MNEVLEKYYKEGWLIKQTHPTLPLTIWNYSPNTQYEGKWDDITLMCRGLVTDSEGNIVAKPFPKFFNYEELIGNKWVESKIPNEPFEVYEKMDGSLIIVFWYDGCWVIASRGSFTSDQAIGASKVFFDKLDNNFSIGITYIFEFTAPWNRIVVDYGKEDNLTLLAAIRTEDGTEATYEQLQMIAKGANCDVVKRYDGIGDYSVLKGMIADNAEGFVIRFESGIRMKIKGEEYLRLHRIMTNLSSTAVWEIVSNGENIEDLIKDVPDEFYNKIKMYVNELKYGYYQYYNQLGKTYDYFRFGKYGDIEIEPTKKEFAEFIEDKPPVVKSILFAMWDGKDYDKIIWKALKPKFEKL
jgi:RNA ligase